MLYIYVCVRYTVPVHILSRFLGALEFFPMLYTRFDQILALVARSVSVSATSEHIMKSGCSPGSRSYLPAPQSTIDEEGDIYSTASLSRNNNRISIIAI